MIVDTSALVALLFEESDADIYARALAAAESRRMSAVNFVEASIVVEAQTGQGGSHQLDSLIRHARILVEAVDSAQAHIARQAWRDFGKSRHPARLNLGDCFAYALAKVTREPLLFKGDDFRHTDVTAAL